jgi:hypothetical protein
MPSIGRILLLGAVVIVCAIMGWIVYTHPDTAVTNSDDAPVAVLVHATTPILILL